MRHTIPPCIYSGNLKCNIHLNVLQIAKQFQRSPALIDLYTKSPQRKRLHRSPILVEKNNRFFALRRCATYATYNTPCIYSGNLKCNIHLNTLQIAKQFQWSPALIDLNTKSPQRKQLYRSPILVEKNNRIFRSVGA